MNKIISSAIILAALLLTTACESPGGGVSHGYVAVGLNAEVLLSGENIEDGAWTEAAIAGGNHLQDIIYAGGQYAAAAAFGVVYTSPTAAAGSWTTVNVGGTSPWCNGITYGEGKYVVAGGAGGVVFHSATAAAGTWTEVAVAGATVVFNKICFGNGTFVVVGNGGSVWRSDTAETGTWQDASIAAGADFWDILFDGSKFIVVGTSGSIYWSADASAGSWADVSPGGLDLLAVTFSGSAYIALGACSYGPVLTQTWTSANGTNWTSVTIPDAYYLRDVIYADGKFIALGDQAILWSPDGSTGSWTDITHPGMQQLRAIVYN